MYACLLFSCSISQPELPQKTAELSPQTTQNLQVIKDSQPAEVWQRREGQLIKVNGTTLGADDAGLAALRHLATHY